MKSPICEMFDIEFPMLAFSHCRDVVAAVSKAGGMGVLGAVGHSPEQLEIDLNWIDKHCDGKPYGVDVLIPNKYEGKGQGLTNDDYRKMIPEAHRNFRADILEQHDVDGTVLRSLADSEGIENSSSAALGRGLKSDYAKRVLEVAFAHPTKLIANALGVPPDWMLQMGKDNNVKVAALVGKKEHAIKQVEAGVDLLVVSGT